MRRLSAILMIAALLAALVPSAVMAGKPLPPNITQIEVYGAGGEIGSCSVTVKATFEGRAYAAQFTQFVSYTATPLPEPVTLPKGSTLVTQEFGGLNFVSVHEWQVQLQDRKGKPLGTAEKTGMDTWGGSFPCPQGTNLIASWYEQVP